MTVVKERLTISLEHDVLEAVRAEVKAGVAPSLSAAIEKALRDNGRRKALKEAIELAEAEHGPVSEEMEEWAIKELMRASREISSSTPER